MVDDLDIASGDVFYLDIQKKTAALLTITEKLRGQCEAFPPEPTWDKKPGSEKGAAKPTDAKDSAKNGDGESTDGEGRNGETKDGEVKAEAGVDAGAAKSLLLGSPITAAAALIGAVPGALSAVGDIVGHFKSDYVIKAQTPQNLNDYYAQTLVAGKIKEAHKVYWQKFQTFEDSALLGSIIRLIRKHLKLLTGVERLKSYYIDPKEAEVQALTTHLATLRSKLAEYLVKVDDHTIETLKREIEAVNQQLKAHHESRSLDTQITGLETHLTSLRSKLVDELVKAGSEAITAVEKEIKSITDQLAANDTAAVDKKLAASTVTALNEQLKLLQTQLTSLIVSTASSHREVLEAEIGKTTTALETAIKKRLPDSQITHLETHYANLQAKLVEFLVKNDTLAKQRIEDRITEVNGQIEAAQTNLTGAKAIVNGAAKATETINAFITQITSVPSGGTQTPLVNACLQEALRSGQIQYLLNVKLVSSGGDFLTKKAPFWQWKVKTSYYAGGVISYLLVEKYGRVVASGTVADVAAMDHTLGEEPDPLDWQL